MAALWEVFIWFLSVSYQLLVNKSKRKRRRRADKALTGTEKIKIINMMTGKKVGYSCVQLSVVGDVVHH